MRKKYNPNEPFWLNRSIERTERTLARDKAKLEALKIQQAINEIDHKLKILTALQRAIKPWIKEDDRHQRVILEGPLDPYAGEH